MKATIILENGKQATIELNQEQLENKIKELQAELASLHKRIKDVDSYLIHQLHHSKSATEHRAVCKVIKTLNSEFHLEEIL